MVFNEFYDFSPNIVVVGGEVENLYKQLCESQTYNVQRVIGKRVQKIYNFLIRVTDGMSCVSWF